jgi:hypothetical protein
MEEAGASRADVPEVASASICLDWTLDFRFPVLYLPLLSNLCGLYNPAAYKSFLLKLSIPSMSKLTLQT